MSSYADFVDSKRHHGDGNGFAPLWMPSVMFDFQQAMTEFNLRRGRSATFADCGLGKTLMELVYGQNVVQHTNKPVLHVTPLAVGGQTLEEAEKFGVEAVRCQDGNIAPGARIIITNYERVQNFDPSQFGGVVCDESSAIKNFNGQRKGIVTEFMKRIPYRLMATATAAPNDYIELGTSSEALGELGYMDMLNRFFRNDQNTSDTRTMTRRPIAHGGPVSSGWRFKGHAEREFWRFVVGWARACRKPSDLGFADDRFVLPPLVELEHVVETRTLGDGMLFPLAASNNREEREEARRTLIERCEKAAELAAGQSSVVWCHLNDEGDYLEKIMPKARQVKGSTSEEEREEIYRAFKLGQIESLIIKDKIGAWGMNWQHCRNVVRFVSHSFESDYQAVRRCWRFGQEKQVTVHRVRTEGQERIQENHRRKAAQADRMFGRLVEQMNNAIKIDLSRVTIPMEVPAWL